MVKMSTVEEFIASPSEEILDLCTKEQLLKIAMKKHYGIDVSNFSLLLLSMLISSLTFEQQRVTCEAN